MTADGTPVSGGGGPGGRGRRRSLRGAAAHGPRPLATTLREALDELGDTGSAPRELPRLGTVFSSWEDAVGEGIARHATPLRIEAGRLVVAVWEPAWATQVRALADGILDRLRERSGEELSGLDVVVRRPGRA